MIDDTSLESYSFELPEDLIAQAPAARRDASRLLVVDRHRGVAREARFIELTDLLPAGALLVANNSKVLPARLLTTKPTGGAVEFLMLTPMPLVEPRPGLEGGWSTAEAEGLLRASKKPKPGAVIDFAEDLSLTVIERGEFGRSRVVLNWRGDLKSIFERIGHMPLPPYIHRPDSAEDRSRYQTLHARDDKQGSVAAPTAGLHFTPELRAGLAASGFAWAEVSLHVGYGTFSPVRAADIRDHRMHAEFVEVPQETADAVAQAKAEGRPVFAVGTTSARALEGAFAATGSFAPFTGWTDIFIRPGHTFAVVDGMLTNFHLPGSSLVIMVAALAGKGVILNAYAHAIRERFRFFSYGDAMLIR
ncbi:tRNA preQ1(34) S-adenosylmethionine ribosyltransferase-isomerase QueA [Fundidesulfovibrio terrae]|uniref:tRNA preQ1(34) S-adenosylmethionine ribosyltransferase-isomerase QueA n=1 Tax=Fundidesulfovibrio terrae TaxID=2922866 RepID=UPI001FAF7788|nr:tRNA preQ1(34) S-adenosylmethionine ribosyltransferase-isomerase QueA [Fundidesulfovibrio terrae]